MPIKKGYSTSSNEIRQEVYFMLVLILALLLFLELLQDQKLLFCGVGLGSLIGSMVIPRLPGITKGFSLG